MLSAWPLPLWGVVDRWVTALFVESPPVLGWLWPGQCSWGWGQCYLAAHCSRRQHLCELSGWGWLCWWHFCRKWLKWENLPHSVPRPVRLWGAYPGDEELALNLKPCLWSMHALVASSYDPQVKWKVDIWLLYNAGGQNYWQSLKLWHPDVTVPAWFDLINEALTKFPSYFTRSINLEWDHLIDVVLN